MSEGSQPVDSSDEAEQAFSQPLITTQYMPSNQEAAAKAAKQQSSEEEEFDDGPVYCTWPIKSPAKKEENNH